MMHFLSIRAKASNSLRVPWAKLRRKRLRVYTAICLTFYVVLFVHLQKNFARFENPFDWLQAQNQDEDTIVVNWDRSWHPIDNLIKRAEEDFQQTLTKEVFNLSDAATAYRSRRGRHPPPDFDRWFAFAQGKQSLIIEDFFDQIYQDLELFWSVPAKLLRSAPLEWPFVVTVRNHTARLCSTLNTKATSAEPFLEMVQLLEQFLPDLNIALNIDDMPHVIIPWEEVSQLVSTAAQRKHANHPSKTHASIQTTYRPLAAIPPSIPLPTSKPTKSEKSYWHYAREACPPGSEARTTDLEEEDDPWAPLDIPTTWPTGSHHGYVSNWTLSKSPCAHPHLSNLHGSLYAPTENDVVTSPFPLFSSCKIQGVNNDILLPPGYYWSEELNFNAGKGEVLKWEEKRTGFFWRGSATGGRHDGGNWRRFHRMRFVAMQNATLIAAEEAFSRNPTTRTATSSPSPTNHTPPPEPLHIFPLPDLTLYPLTSLPTSPNTSLSTHTPPLTSILFTNYLCAPWDLAPFADPHKCAYLQPYFSISPYTSPSDQFTFKYIPDIDGHAWSARYRGYLRSGSLPVKATVFAEWLDGRVWAWRHFVPMHNEFADWWGLVEWLVGFGGEVGGAGLSERSPEGSEERKGGHDKEASLLASAGRTWSERVLRREDMLIYLYRLLLEYARLCDERREDMGFIGDLP